MEKFASFSLKDYNALLTEESKVRSEYDDETERLNDMNRKRTEQLAQKQEAPEGFSAEHERAHWNHGFLGRRLDRLQADMRHMERLRTNSEKRGAGLRRTTEGDKFSSYLSGNIGAGSALSTEAQEVSKASMDEFLKSQGDSDEVLRAWGKDNWPHPNGLFVTAPLIERVAGDAATGQEAVPVEYPNWMVRALKAFDAYGDFIQNITTPTGAKRRVMNIDPTARNARRLTAEGSAINDVDAPNIGFTELDAWTYTSDFIPVTREWQQDTILENQGMTEMQNLCLRSIAALVNTEITTTSTATPTKAPEGLVSAAKEGYETASASTYDYYDLVNLMFAVDPAYWEGQEADMYGNMTENGGRVGWTLSYDALKVGMGLKDTQNRPLWLPSLRDGTPGTILGYPYKTNANMDKVVKTTCTRSFGATTATTSSAWSRACSFSGSGTAARPRPSLRRWWRSCAAMAAPSA